jgi:predicted TIM-barrel fold metal-dependent hydrolase
MTPTPPDPHDIHTEHRPGLIDVHSHYLPDFYLTAARAAGHLEPDGFQWPDWSAPDHLAMMDRLGIAVAVLSVSSPGVHFGDDQAAAALARAVNEAGAQLVLEHPDRFKQFGSLPLPDVGAAVQEAGYALDTLGCVGVAIETNAHGVYLGDSANEPLWTMLAARDAVVFIHPTSPPCWQLVSLGRPRPMLEFIFDTTRAVSDLIFSGVLERHPSIRFVITHCGGALPLLGDRIEAFRRMAGDGGAPTGELLARLWYDLAGSPIPHQLNALVSAVGTERLLYGSDYCFTPEPGVAAQIAALDGDLGPDDHTTWRQLTTRNAARLWT